MFGEKKSIKSKKEKNLNLSQTTKQRTKDIDNMRENFKNLAGGPIFV